MNKTKKIAVWGIVALFTVLAVSIATAHVTLYLEPQHSSVPESFGYTTEVKVMANVTGADNLQGGQFNIEYDTSCCNVTDLVWGSGIFSGFSVWNPIGLPECYPPGREHIRAYFMSVQSDVVAEICTLTFYCNSTEYCQTDVTFPCPPSGPCITEVMNETNDNLYPDNATLLNGTFTCGEAPPPQTFDKDLVEGWNLVSLPLTTSDMTVGSVFSSVTDSAIYSYDAETKNFVVLNGTDVLENGVGYFIHMTSAGTWTYEGDAYTQMNEPLSHGLNMVGWLNCTKDIEDALSSIEGKYRYVARWNAQVEKYKVYVPGAPSALNDFDTMEPGVGYFVSMKEGATLSEIC